jgi:hypothetical protein
MSRAAMFRCCRGIGILLQEDELTSGLVRENTGNGVGFPVAVEYRALKKEIALRVPGTALGLMSPLMGDLGCWVDMAHDRLLLSNGL